MKPEDHSREQRELAGWPVVVESYRLDSVYHCTITNADPGARIARGVGASKEEAEQNAIEKATRYLAQTRRHGVH
jgi:dsRNA-specific ribonuclease